MTQDNGNKVYRVTVLDAGTLREFITRAFTCEHATMNTYDAYGKSVRVKAVEVIDYL